MEIVILGIQQLTCLISFNVQQLEQQLYLLYVVELNSCDFPLDELLRLFTAVKKKLRDTSAKE